MKRGDKGMRGGGRRVTRVRKEEGMHVDGEIISNGRNMGDPCENEGNEIGKSCEKERRSTGVIRGSDALGRRLRGKVKRGSARRMGR